MGISVTAAHRYRMQPLNRHISIIPSSSTRPRKALLGSLRTVWLQMMKKKKSPANRFAEMRAGWREGGREGRRRETSLFFQSRQVKYAVSAGQRSPALSCKEEVWRASCVFVADVQTSVEKHQSVTATHPPHPCFPMFSPHFCYIHDSLHPARVCATSQARVYLYLMLLKHGRTWLVPKLDLSLFLCVNKRCLTFIFFICPFW